MKNELLTEFDIDIPEIQLIHECTFAPHLLSPVYAQGRMSFGFVYALEGCAEYLCGDGQQSFFAEPGDLLFLTASSRYTVRTDDEPFRHYTLNFLLSPDREKNGSLYEIFSTGSFIKLTVENPAAYENLFRKILDIWNTKKSGFMLSAKACLYELLYEYFTEYGLVRVNRNDYDRVSPVKKYIDRHFTETIRVETLSELCGVSPTHLRRLFNEIYGSSPLEYQIGLRILKAKDLLLSKYYTISEVADMTGFSDMNYFSRTFKAHVGISPLKYKQTH